MGMVRMGVSDTGLRRFIGFRSGVETPHPADLMGVDAFRGSRHAFRLEVGTIGEHAGQHGGDVLRRISRPDMGELIGETGPFMHLPEQIGDFHQRIHVADFCIEVLSCGGNVA